MRYISPLVHYIVIPALVGCIVALSILLWAPDLNSIKTFNNGSPINAPTSYAEAVELAAPTVVNIYTSTLIHRERHPIFDRSEEHTSELQSRPHLVCRLLLEKKKNKHIY